MKTLQSAQNSRMGICYLLIALLFMLGASNLYADTLAVNYESDQIVVKLKPSTPIETINSEYGVTSVRRLLNNADIYLLQAASPADASRIVAAMGDDLAIEYAELNLIASAPEASGRDIYGWPDEDSKKSSRQTSDPRLLFEFEWEMKGSESAHYYQQPTLHQVKADHSLSQGAGVVVAVLDTGIDRYHPLLSGHISDKGYDFIDDDTDPRDEFNNRDDDGDGFIDEVAGHGTHVAGIVHLIAPQAQIMPLRVLDSDGQGNSFVVAEAMLYAMENGADVINLSLGTTSQSQFLLDVVAQVTNAGVFVVAAAGNLGQDVPQYPAAAECALAVTAVSSARTKAEYANYGAWVDLSVPSERIYSSYPNGSFAWWNGTSMAAPFVSGQAALMLSHSPSLTLEQVGDLMAGTAVSLDSANADYAGQLGAGLINIQASLTTLANGNFPNTASNPLSGCANGK